MLYADMMDVPVEVFGGYTPAIPPQDLPPGASPLCQDVVFPEGSVRQRGGLLNFFGAPGGANNALPANAAVNGLKTYTTPLIVNRLLAWDSLGNLYKESPQGTLNLLFSRPYTNLFYQSTTLFGREYQVFFNSTGGFDVPRQYDDTLWDRVSEVGPGTLFGVMGAVDSATAGNIAAGKHQVSVAFINRQGFISPAAPPIMWTAAGNKQVALSVIPIGPSNIKARLILFTPVIVAPAVTGSFYSLPNGTPQLATPTVMVIADNVTTATTLDFTDAILIAGFSANYLFTQLELGECSFVGGYSSRLIYLGERNKLQNFSNLTFDGGFVAGLPLGWTGGIGGSQVAGDAMSGYAITGDGVSAQRGLIQQSAYQDYLQVPIIQRNTAYGVRARVARSGGLTQGVLHINLQSTTGGFTTVGLSVTFAQATQSFAEFTANLTDNPIVTPQADMVLQVYADGTPNNAGVFIVDSIEVFPLQAPFNYSTARVSHAFNPESFDGTTGQVQVRPGDGQQLRAGFPLRASYYLAKDHYLCSITDDGQNEPSSWPVNEVSATVGICGPNAVDWTEEWAVFAERSGLYIFWGADPVKISMEVQEDASLTGKTVWNSINWQFAYTIWVRIDRTNKRILVGVPTGANTSPNVVFVLDYKWLETAQDIANSPMVTYSAFTGKILAHGRGRRWTYWNITSNSMCFAERADGTAQPFFGNGAANGKIYQQIEAPTQLSDDSAAINSQYATYYAPSAVEEQMLRLSSHRKLLGYMKWRAIGAGSLLISVQQANRVTNLRSTTLSTAPKGDNGRTLNLHGERFSIQVGTNSSASWWQLEKLILCMRKDAAIPVRGAAV